jgi:hypothetical protein
VDIALEPKAFEQSKSGAITGPIWIHHEATDFPERGWSDFPVRILSWWLDAIGNLNRGAKDAVFSFMDGPFEFKVSDGQPGGFRVQLIERRLDTQSIVLEFGVSLQALQTSLHLAAASALVECDRRGWAGQDVENLRSFAASLRH